MSKLPLDRHYQKRDGFTNRRCGHSRVGTARSPVFKRPARGSRHATTHSAPDLWRAMHRTQSQFRLRSAIWTGMREPLVLELCSAHACRQRATIYHRNKPLCGKHALERLEQDMADGKALPLKD